MSEDINTVILRIAVNGSEVTCFPLSPLLQYGIDAGFLVAAPVSMKTEDLQSEEIHLSLSNHGFIHLTTNTTYFRENEDGNLRHSWICGYDAYYSGMDSTGNEFCNTASFTTQQRDDWNAGWKYAQLEFTGVTKLPWPINMQFASKADAEAVRGYKI